MKKEMKGSSMINDGGAISSSDFFFALSKDKENLQKKRDLLVYNGINELR